MSAEITREDIHSLPPYAKIALAARCVRIAWVFARRLFPILPDNMLSVLQAVECWGENITECDIAKESFAKQQQQHLQNSNDKRICDMPTCLQRYSTERDQNIRTLASAIEEAFKTAVSPKGNLEEEDKVTDNAKSAYDKARLSARLSSREPDLMARARRDFERLKKHCEDISFPGNVPTTFFTSLYGPE